MNIEAIQMLNDDDNSFNVKVSKKYRPYLFFLDFGIRCSIFYLYWISLISAWALIGLNLLLVILFAVYNAKVIKKTKERLTNNINVRYNKDKITFEILHPHNEIIVLLDFLIGIIFTYWFLYDIWSHEWYMHVLMAFCSLLGGIFFLSAFGLTEAASSKTKIIKYNVIKTDKISLEKIDVTKYFTDLFTDFKFEDEPENIQLESVDYNDTQIAKLESELKSINSRVDAYLLESVLLGGLAFSGFLTVLSSNIITEESVVFSGFCSHCNIFWSSFSTDITQTIISIDHFFTRSDFFILIMFLCLLSSVFFLLVLTLRMRYMSLSIEMDHLIRIMIAFNAKEEELTNIKFENEQTFHKSQKDRLEKIIKKVDSAISDADKLMDELNPVKRIMTSCRNVAVFVFYSVLVVSGFYFSSFIALLILLVAIMVISVRSVLTFLRSKKVNTLLSRHK